MPAVLVSPKSWYILGLRRSNPISRVFFPFSAKIDARLMETNVLPALTMSEVIRMVCFSFPLAMNCRLVRTDLKDSAMDDFGEPETTRLVSLVL